MNSEPEVTEVYRDDSLGYEAYLVIDSFRGHNNSCGGIRILPDVTLEEVSHLARSMTLKYAFCNLQPVGGAKAGIKIPPNCDERLRKEILNAVGERLSPYLVEQIYLPASDMGSTNRDVEFILNAAKAPSLDLCDTAFFTALTVYQSARTAIDVLGLKTENAECVIEGFGSVGRHLAEELLRDMPEMKLTAISNLKGGLHHSAGLDVRKLVALYNHYGDDFVNRYQGAGQISKEDIYKLKTDVLFLCGRWRSITKNRVDELGCKIICPAANNPLEDGIEYDIQRRNILYIPDFVANAGGSCCTFLYLKGVGTKQMKRQYLRKEFSDVIRALIVNGQRTGKPPSHFALHVASRNLESAGSDEPQQPKKLTRFQRRLQRSAPKRLLARPFLREIKRSMERNIDLIKDWNA